MKERVFLIMSKNRKVAEFDITDADFKEIVEIVGIQKEMNRECCVKRVFIDKEV